MCLTAAREAACTSVRDLYKYMVPQSSYSGMCSRKDEHVPCIIPLRTMFLKSICLISESICMALLTCHLPLCPQVVKALMPVCTFFLEVSD